MDTFLGVPIIRTIIFWGLYWGPLFLETTIYGPFGFWVLGLGYMAQTRGQEEDQGRVRFSKPAETCAGPRIYESLVGRLRRGLGFTIYGLGVLFKVGNPEILQN